MKIAALLTLLAAASGIQAQNVIPISREPIQSLQHFTNTRHRFSNFGSAGRLLNNYNKKNGINKRDGGARVTLTTPDTVHYLGRVTVGMNQPFDVVLDTGSSDVFVRGSGCTTYTGPVHQLGSGPDTSCQGSKLIIDSTISPVQVGGSTVQVKLAYGSTDLPTSVAVLQVYSGPIGIATTLSEMKLGAGIQEYGLDTFDGIVGLAFDELSEISSTLKDKGVSNHTANFVDGLPQQDRIFGFYVSSNANGDTGEFTLAGYDNSKFTGDITYVPLSEQLYWNVDFTGATYSLGNGGASGSLSGGITGAIVDSGTPSLVLDDKVAASLNAAIGAQYDSTYDLYVVDCNNVKNLPDLTMTFSGKSFVIPAIFYVIQFEDAGDQLCISAIMGGAANNDLVIIGVPLFRAYYTIFDKNNARIGFAKANHNGLLPTFGNGGAPTQTGSTPKSTNTGNSNNNNNNNNSSSSSSSGGFKVWYAGAAVGAVVLIGGVAFFLIRRRKQNADYEAKSAAYAAGGGASGLQTVAVMQQTKPNYETPVYNTPATTYAPQTTYAPTTTYNTPQSVTYPTTQQQQPQAYYAGQPQVQPQSPTTAGAGYNPYVQQPQQTYQQQVPQYQNPYAQPYAQDQKY
ncbi:Vacuolar protease A [Blyttiomyces sp. JEL0837]|nr:Vacuolar protease A [Blyttiomyces sp. JEL0837]